MKEKFADSFVSRILLINGTADLTIACGMIFFGRLMGASTGMELFTGGGWGIATIALGLWRIWASGKPEAFWFTAIGGIIEGGTLVIYSIVSFFIFSLQWSDVIIAAIFGSTFFILYLAAFFFKKRK